MTDKERPEPQNPGPQWIHDKALAEGRFLIQSCESCGGHVHYPRLLCVHCGSDRLSAVEASGVGRVYSTSVIRQRPERGGDYNVALIDLDEGPRLMSRVEGLDPADVSIGMKVKARIASIDGESLIVFEKA